MFVTDFIFVCIVSATAAVSSASPSVSIQLSSSSRGIMSVNSSGRVLSGRPVGSSSSGQKTILLVQAVSKASTSPASAAGGSGIQSLMLPASMRTIATVAASHSARLNHNVSMSRLPTDSLTVTPARLGVRVVSGVVSVPSSSSITSSGMSPGQSQIDVQTPYGLVFNSRTIQADGTVCTSKEYLCNFCQFKVSTTAALLEHSSTHLFSCNHCLFRSTSRLESLIHKRDSHPSTTDELAGFEDLDHPTLVLKTTRMPRVVGTAFLPSLSSTTGMRLGASSSLTHASRSAGMSVLSTASSSTRPAPTSLCSPSTSLSSSSVVRTMSGKTGDSYFTYRIAHDSDGRVQAYECDVCGFRSVHINEMFSHASTHSLADLAKSGTATVNNVVWECYYCAFSAPLQATVVSHVIACHPNQPIQLKRLPTTPAAVTSETSAEPPAVSSKAATLSSQPSPSLTEQSSSDKPGLPPAAATADGSTTAKPASAKTEKKKRSDANDEGCIWGCYYCTMQSASRNDIISHLKKQHSSEKLVVTRRRITHVATGSGKPSPAAKAATTCSDQNQPPSHTAETTPASRLEVGTAESSGTVADDGDKTGTSGKSRKRHLSASVSDDHLQPVLSSATSGDNGEANDGNAAVGGASSAKSRRKQMAPRRVADELAAAAAADEPLVNDSAALTAGDAVKDAAMYSDALPAVMSAAPAVNSSRTLLTAGSGPRRHGRSSTSKYDTLIKKLKMAESEEAGMEIAGLLDRPRVDEAPKTSSATRSSHGKALSLLTGQLVSGYVQPPNGIPTLSSHSRDHLPPIPNCESSPGAKGGLLGRRLSGLKVDVVQYVERKAVDRSRSYVYDSERLTARCVVCGTTAHGSDVVRQIREHVAAHFNECRWACAYCTFQCNRRVAIVAHVTQWHRGQPLRIIRRRPHHGNRNKVASDLASKQEPSVSLTTDVGVRQKLRGPRCRRDQQHISTTAVMWQCAFCSRRSLFRGLIAIHMRLAHFDHAEDLCAAPHRWIRPPVNFDATSPDIDMKRAEVRLVRIEDVDCYPALSDVVLSNGTDLIRELDVDGEDDVVADPENTSNGDSDAAEFRCIHCPFRGMTPAVVKCHILQAHRLEDVTILDLRSSRRLHHEHLLMCWNVECQFVSSVERDFRAHVSAHPSHLTSNVAAVSHSESKSVDHPRRALPQSKNVSKSLSSDTAPVSSQRAVVAGSARSRRGTDGPIEYNDDGTMKGVDLGNRVGNMKMQCTHCCTVMCCDVSEMRKHLSSAHPRLVPLAIDVDCADRSLPASLFLCLVADCDFVTSYYNVYKHHMDEEHPDSEPGSRSRYQRPSSAAKRHSAPSGKQDRSFAANVRRPKKPTAVLNSSVDNGHYSPLIPSDDLAVLAAADDTDNPAASRKSSSHNTQYSSQDFDFSRRYKCILCSHTAATLADMKSHLTSHHDSTTAHQCIDRRARQLRKRQGIYFCPDPKCAFCCKFDDELALHMDQEHPSLVVSKTAALPTKSPPPSDDSGCAAGDRVYQCAHCTYITTDLRNVRVHVIAEHATSEGGFAEIKTAVSSDGSLIMNVNDAVSTKSSTVGGHKSMLENGDNLLKKTGSNVKVDDEGKVFAVL